MNIHQLIIGTGMAVFAYLVGSVPFGLILARVFVAKDLRRIGSGNIGATNALRAGGWKLGITTLACDVLKGALPVYLAGLLTTGRGVPTGEVWMSITALAAFLGHLFPAYLRFKTGGKGVATAAGCFAVLSPPALAIAFVSFLVVAGVSNRVSAGSLAAALVLPAGVAWAEASLIPAGCAAFIAAAIILRHRDNISRLLSGTEPVIWKKKDKP